MTRSESDKFCLRWNDFCSNLGAALEEVREEKELYDVTVACEGGGEFPAHRLVLSACSQVMRQILCRKSQLGGRHHQEVVYLRGVASQDLQHILTFMYCGEVSIAQEQINSFLVVAEDLQVKGLTQNKSRTESSKQSSLSQRHTSVSEGSQQETTPAPTTTNVKRESNTWKLTSPSKISSLHDEREIVHYDNGGVDGDNIYDDEYTSQFDDQNLAYGSGGVHKNMRNTGNYQSKYSLLITEGSIIESSYVT